MKKKILTFGDRDIVIAELNTAQVEELTTVKPEDADDTWWRNRMWRTIMLSLNNATNIPTKENPLGSDTEPLSVEDVKPTIGYVSVMDIHRAVMDLSGLKSAVPGESKADAEKPSTSILSTAA